MRSKQRRRRRCVISWLLVAAICAIFVRWGVPALLKAAYPIEYREEVLLAASQYEVEPSLVMAVIHTESGFAPDARSAAGAIGLMQVTEPTMEWVLMRQGIHEIPEAEKLTEPAFNIEIGTGVLHLLSEQFADEDTMLAAYNAGMGRVQAWLLDKAYSGDGVTLHTIPFAETRGYIKKVRLAQIMYQRLYGL